MKKIKTILLIIILMLFTSVDAKENIVISENKIELTKGENATFKISCDNVAGIIKITSSNPDIASVDVSKYFFDTSLNDSEVVVTVNAKEQGDVKINVILKDIATFDGVELTGTKEIDVTVNEKEEMVETNRPQENGHINNSNNTNETNIQKKESENEELILGDTVKIDDNKQTDSENIFANIGRLLNNISNLTENLLLLNK